MRGGEETCFATLAKVAPICKVQFVHQPLEPFPELPSAQGSGA